MQPFRFLFFNANEQPQFLLKGPYSLDVGANFLNERDPVDFVER
jgi:hypothetical protein